MRCFPGYRRNKIRLGTRRRVVRRRRCAGITLVELVLVIALLVSLAMFALPDILRQIERERLPTSARQMRALLTLVRANAMLDGKRYRIRFPQEDEIDSEGQDRQPLVEREDDPLREPGEFALVTEPWTQGATLLRDVWCAEVRLGKPTIEELEQRFIEQRIAELMDAEDEDYEPEHPPLYIDPDGTSEWASFLVTDAPRDTEPEDLEAYGRIEVILDGLTGLCWLQRPFYEDEIAMLKENGWPPVLRKDFFRRAPLTEADVLEISETAIRR